MHEMALAESVLAIVERTARGSAAARVMAVRLDIGALSHVDPEALRTCFEVVKRHSVAADAALEIESTPGQGWCMQCAKTVALPARGEPCPDCGSYQVEVTRGADMRVRDIAVI